MLANLWSLKYTQIQNGMIHPTCLEHHLCINFPSQHTLKLVQQTLLTICKGLLRHIKVWSHKYFTSMSSSHEVNGEYLSHVLNKFMRIAITFTLFHKNFLLWTVVNFGCFFFILAMPNELRSWMKSTNMIRIPTERGN